MVTCKGVGRISKVRGLYLVMTSLLLYFNPKEEPPDLKK